MSLQDTQKPLVEWPRIFDKQTARFLATVAENMPALNGKKMQAWIEAAPVLQRVLKKSLGLGPQAWEKHERIQTSSKEAHSFQNYDPISFDFDPATAAKFGGMNSGYIRFGVEYDGDMPVLRPWLEVEIPAQDDEYDKEDPLAFPPECVGVEMRSRDYWRGYSAPMLNWFIRTEKEALLPKELFARAEEDYVHGALKYVRDVCTFQIGVTEELGGWVIHLHWLKDGQCINTFRFGLWRKVILKEFEKMGQTPPANLSW